MAEFSLGDDLEPMQDETKPGELDRTFIPWSSPSRPKNIFHNASFHHSFETMMIFRSLFLFLLFVHFSNRMERSSKKCGRCGDGRAEQQCILLRWNKTGHTIPSFFENRCSHWLTFISLSLLFLWLDNGLISCAIQQKRMRLDATSTDGELEQFANPIVSMVTREIMIIECFLLKWQFELVWFLFISVFLSTSLRIKKVRSW